MSELVAELLQGLDGLHPSVLYLLAGLFTALETSVGIGGGLGLWPHLSGPAVAQPVLASTRRGGVLMPIDEAKLDDGLDRFVTDPGGTGHVPATDRSHPSPVGTWTIDPADSRVSFAWPKFRLWSITGRLHCMGVIHLDGLPSVGVVRFEQPSGLPVLTMTLDPASVETGDADLDAMLRGPDYFDAVRHRWWTLRSESLEVLPTGTWRVMATLTARGTAALVELRFAVIPGASGPDGLVLRGRGVLDRRAFGIGRQAWSFGPLIQLDLVVRANRAAVRTRIERQEGEAA
jgi:polyisoprenoid-binding protein YceI